MMLLNLFMFFDPINSKFPLNLIISLFSIFLMIKMFWINNFMLNLIIYINIFTININTINNKFIMNIMNSLLFMMFTFNLLNLNPNFLSYSSNLNFTLSLTMMFWMNMMMYWFFNNNLLFINLSPKNTPLIMLWIINLIELNSIFFQIISLSMRLMINMIMGHIIIILLNYWILIYLYLMFEFFIIIIQSYIFFILNMLNFNNLN